MHIYIYIHCEDGPQNLFINHQSPFTRGLSGRASVSLWSLGLSGVFEYKMQVVIKQPACQLPVALALSLLCRYRNAVCMYVNMYVCMHACTYVCMCVFAHACVYVSMSVCIALRVMASRASPKPAINLKNPPCHLNLPKNSEVPKPLRP